MAWNCLTLDDALGNPIDLFLTSGGAHDLFGADHVLPTMQTAILIAGKAFDADVIAPLATAGKAVVIPSRRIRSSNARHGW